MYVNINTFSLSIIFSIFLFPCLNAQVMDIGTNYYRDYIDFAQNKGAFTQRDTPLKFNQRNGDTFTFERIPNNSARNNKGNFTSLGRNFVVTAQHTLRAAAANNFNENRGWFGNTKYEYLTSYTSTSTQKLYNSDTTYMRTTKYIVEGSIDPLDVPNLEISSADQNKAGTESKNISEYIKQIKTKEGSSGNYIIAYQAGTGLLGLEKPKTDSDGYSSVVSATELERQNITNKSLGGSVNEISANYSVLYKKRIDKIQIGGLYILASTNKEFRNRLLPGDSGSGFFVYDTIKQKWVLIGVLSVVADVNNYVSIVTKADFDDYAKPYENAVNGENITNSNLVKDKDNILTNTSNITLNSDLDLGHGGIVVKSGNVTIKGSHKISKFAGFDIAQNATLNLNVKADTNVHKIGKGSLIVNSNSNKTLRLGEGIVELKTPNAFKDIYITSGRGLLKLGTNDDLNNKIFFGNGGGELDLNGYNQAFGNLAANSSSAKIINSNSQKSTLTINGTKSKDTIFHANVSKNINIKHSANKALIFDGGFDISGNVELNNAKVTLQGHPTTHALGDKSILTQMVKNKISSSGLTTPDYMDLTRPSTFDQPDWDERKFATGGGINLNSSELSIGKYAHIQSDINAINSTINLSGNITHYIDKFDGSNTYNQSSSDDTLKYRQEAESKNLLVEDVNFQNKITMSGSSLLKVGGRSTKLRDLVINAENRATNNIVAGSGKFEIENLDVNAPNKLGFEPDVSITKCLKITNFSNIAEPALDFKKVLTLGNGMKFEVDFASINLEANKKYALINAQNIVNNGAKFNTSQKINNLFTNYEIKNGKIFLTLSNNQGQNPNTTPGTSKPNLGSNPNPNSPQKSTLKIAEFDENQNKIFQMLKDTPEYKNALQNGNTDKIKQMVKKSDLDMKEISRSCFDINVKTLQTSNEMMNLRLSHLLFSKVDFSEFKIAGLESDIKPTAAMVYEAVMTNRRQNSFWANINGAFFKNNQHGGDLKFYGTNIGYDRIYDDFIIGVNTGASKAKFSSDNLNDDATIYNFGAYGFYEYNIHEFQSNLNFTFINSARSVVDSQKVDVKSNGALLSNYYKYKILLNKDSKYSQIVKPIFSLEFGKFSASGFKNERYKQKGTKNFTLTSGVGIEYMLSSDENAFVWQFLVKKNLYNCENKSYISLNNSNKYIDYELSKDSLNYNLNLTANIKFAKYLGVSYQFTSIFDNNRNYGISGSMKFEYKF